MGVYGGPDIITDGLRCYIDPSNSDSVSSTSDTAYDLSGYGFHGILRNSSGIQTQLGSMETNLTYDTSDSPKACLNFVGYGNSTQGYLEWDSHPCGGYSNYSMESWFKIVSTTPASEYNVVFFSSAPSSGFQEFGLISQASTSDPDVGFEIDNQWTGGASNVRLGLGWHHIVHSYDGDNSYMYINGELRYTKDHPNNNVLPTSGWNWIGVGQWANNGYAGGNGYTQGKLGLIKLYGKSLSSGEVLQNYNVTKSRFGL